MLDILTASPSVGAWKCEPMTTTEIDAHPDRDRIWATIKAMQDGQAHEIETLAEDHDGAVYDAEEKASDEGYTLGRKETLAEALDLLKTDQSEGSTGMQNAIDAVVALAGQS